jgi:hypothetical protein
MSDNIYPFQHSPYEEPVNPFKDVLDMIRASHAQAATIVEAAKQQEELHKHNIRIVNGMHYAIRWCIVPGCMQSWRLPVRMDGIDEPIAEWEPISEPVDLSGPILPDYED